MCICLFLVFVWTGVHSASGLTRLCTLEGEDRVFDVHEKKGKMWVYVIISVMGL